MRQFQIKQILPYLGIILLITLWAYFNKEAGKESTGNWSTFITNTYVEEVSINDKRKKIVIFINTNVSSKTKLISNEAFFIDKLTDTLKALNYSYVIIHLPCQEYRCLSDFNFIGDYIIKLDPEEVVFTTMSSGFNTDSLYDKLNSANIPILVFGTDVSIFYNKFIGVDNKAIGKKIGKYVNSIIDAQDKVFVLNTLKGYKIDPNDNGLDRTEAAISELDKAIIFESDATLWSRSKSAELVKQALQHHPDIKWVIAPSYETALGASDAIVESGNLFKVHIAVMDFTYAIAKQIEKGTFDVGVSFDTTGQVAEMIRVIVTNDYIFNDKNKPKKLFSGDIVTKDNIRFRKKSDGTYEL